jgi:hypothetical protein
MFRCLQLHPNIQSTTAYRDDRDHEIALDEDIPWSRQFSVAGIIRTHSRKRSTRSENVFLISVERTILDFFFTFWVFRFSQLQLYLLHLWFRQYRYKCHLIKPTDFVFQFVVVVYARKSWHKADDFFIVKLKPKKKKLNSVAFSPQANYTDYLLPGRNLNVFSKQECTKTYLWCEQRTWLWAFSKLQHASD